MSNRFSPSRSRSGAVSSTAGEKESASQRTVQETQTIRSKKTITGGGESSETENAPGMETPMDYKVEKLKPPLPPWKETKFTFEEVKLEKSKDN